MSGLEVDDIDPRALLRSLFERIDQLERHLSGPTAVPWVTESGSSLERDNELTRPFHLGHQVQRLIHVASDHLSGLRRLMGGGSHGQGPGEFVVNVYADYTLARGALEAATVAHWLLLPTSRATRVERTLSLMNQDFFDERRAGERLARLVPNGQEVLADLARRREERAQWVRDVVERAGISADLPRFRLEDAIAEVDARSGRELLLMWKLMSGMAHGRLWAALTLNQITETLDHGDGTVTIRAEGDLPRVVVAVGDAVFALDALLSLFNQRRTAPRCTG